MPSLSHSNVTRIDLPSSTSDDPAWVDIDLTIDAGVLIDVTEGTDNTRLISARAMAKLIRDWPFTGEDGNKAPITLENVRHLDIRDFNAIDARLNEAIQGVLSGPVVETDEKKA